MASVCVACRDSKVKCERGVGTGDQCARCKRIGLTCTAAPPSQRGKRTSLSQLGARNKLRLSSAADVRDSSTDAVGSSLGLIATFSEAERTAAAKFACLWSGMVIGPGVAVNSRYLAIQKAARARQYNKPDLMIHAMGLCGHFGYSVEDVLSSSQQSVPIPATIEDFPDAMSTMLCASSGYATGRCATGGIVTSVTNASFEAAVITKQALDMLATDSAMGCEDLYAFGRSSYIHAHDLELVNRLLGHLFANEQAETILLVELPELVRVVDRRMNCYVPCSMRGMIKFEEHALFLAIEYVPTGSPSPFETPLLLATLAPHITEFSSASVPDQGAATLVHSSRPSVMAPSGHSANAHASLDLDDHSGLGTALTDGDAGEDGKPFAMDDASLFSSDSLDALIMDMDTTWADDAARLK